LKQSLLDLSRHVIERTNARLADLDDTEYAWTPVPDGWHLRPDGHGGVTMDLAHPEPVPAPFTSLSWRLYHLVGAYAMDRNALWLEVTPPPDPLVGDGSQPVDAAAAVTLLHRAEDYWLAILDAVTESTLAAPLGEKAGPYADATGADYVLHQIDEHIHHSAEIALLRDLYRATVTPPR
jgi:hypothetical protein